MNDKTPIQIMTAALWKHTAIHPANARALADMLLTELTAEGYRVRPWQGERADVPDGSEPCTATVSEAQNRPS